MIIEINKAFRSKKEIPKIQSVYIDREMTIKEIIDILQIENTGYAIFFVNDKQSELDSIITNNDKLIILPLIDGG